MDSVHIQPDVHNDVQKVITYMDTFLELYEDNSWLEEASTVDIKRAFKLAGFLEKLCLKLLEFGTGEHIEKIVVATWKEKGRTRPSKIEVFEEACDLLLIAFFKSPHVADKSLKIAVEEYNSVCGQSRLKDFISNLFREGITYRLINILTVDYSLSSLAPVLGLAWNCMLECGQEDRVKVCAQSAFKNVTHITTVIQLICQSDPDLQYNRLKSLLVDIFISTVKEESEHSNVISVYLVTNIDPKLILTVTNEYPYFLTALLEIMQNLATDELVHCLNDLHNGLCYKIAETEFPLNLVKTLYTAEGNVGFRTHKWLQGLVNREDSPFWEDLYVYCNY